MKCIAKDNLVVDCVEGDDEGEILVDGWGLHTESGVEDSSPEGGTETENSGRHCGMRRTYESGSTWYRTPDCYIQAPTSLLYSTSIFCSSISSIYAETSAIDGLDDAGIRQHWFISVHRLSVNHGRTSGPVGRRGVFFKTTMS